MCCIYQAWEKALLVGHENVRLTRKADYELQLFDEPQYVDFDEEQFVKVERSVITKISKAAYLTMYYAALSYEKDALDTMYRFLILGFRYGASVINRYDEPVVSRMLKLRKSVGNEVCHFKEFARFSSIDNRVYVCHLEPKSNVIHLVGEHFADRMPSEHWMIIDDNRRMAVIHPKDEENYIRILDDYELEALRKTDIISDEYTDMWKAFFDAIAIRQRENYICQRNHIPIWKRKHVTEFH